MHLIKSGKEIKQYDYMEVVKQQSQENATENEEINDDHEEFEIISQEEAKKEAPQNIESAGESSDDTMNDIENSDDISTDEPLITPQRLAELRKKNKSSISLFCIVFVSFKPLIHVCFGFFSKKSQLPHILRV